MRITQRRLGRRILAGIAIAATVLTAACSSSSDDTAGDGAAGDTTASSDTAGTGDAAGDASGDTASSDADAQAGDIVIGLVTKTDSNPFFVKMREAAQAYADSKGVKLVALAGKFDGDNEGQVTALENLRSQGVTGIMITPNSSSGILEAIAAAREAGIYVVALDTATDPEDAVDATFATDNRAAGEMQGKWVKAALGDTTPVLAMLDGTPGGTVDTWRHEGFLKGMGLTEDSAEIAGMENTNGDQSKAQTAMENLIARNKNINAVYTINEPAARGGYQALKDAGLADGVQIGSIDGSCAGVQAVKDGEIGATVMQFPGTMATSGIDAIIAHAQGGTPATGFNDTGSQLITDHPVEGLESQGTDWGLQNCWG